MSVYRVLTGALALVFVGIGIALLVETARSGGGAFGYLIGLLFIAAGVARAYVLYARRSGSS
ncbi:MAG TPA: hypothetical protein VEH52_00735 [Gaiellaceae bacterium]|nr:hypothetical protein [Gaiellaceae bacterium]